jgi:hypothetical protein
MSTSLEKEIEQMEAALSMKKRALKVRSHQVSTQLQETLSSPAALATAAGAGFFAGKLTDRPRPKQTGNASKSNTGFVSTLLRTITGVQTAAGFAKHL